MVPNPPSTLGHVRVIEVRVVGQVKELCPELQPEMLSRERKFLVHADVPVHQPGTTQAALADVAQGPDLPVTRRPRESGSRHSARCWRKRPSRRHCPPGSWRGQRRLPVWVWSLPATMVIGPPDCSVRMPVNCQASQDRGAPGDSTWQARADRTHKKSRTGAYDQTPKVRGHTGDGRAGTTGSENCWRPRAPRCPGCRAGLRATSTRCSSPGRSGPDPCAVGRSPARNGRWNPTS